MNLALSDEQVLLREAARGALSRFKTLEEAREALDSGGAPADLWPTATEAGWPGLLIDEAHGGAELGRVRRDARARRVRARAGGGAAARPPARHRDPERRSGRGRRYSTSWRAGSAARPTWRRARRMTCPSGGASTPRAGWSAPRCRAPCGGGEGEARVSGQIAFAPDAPGADVLVGVALLDDGRVSGFAVESSAAGVSVEAVRRYDATRALGHVTLQDAPATILDAPESSLAEAWHLAQALIAAESLGAVESALDVSVAYAKERFTFGRAIGSYQAVKHSLTEVLRQLENGRSLLYYAGWSRHGAPGEFALAANAARSVAGRALDHAARTMISVHGGIGATWEHDAPLYFRRAQLSRRLLGGTALATDRVAGELIAQG